MIVWMHRSVEAFRRDRGDHLVRVRVARCARPGLEYIDRELIVVLTCRYLTRCGCDGSGHLAIQHPKLGVDRRRGRLDLAKGGDKPAVYSAARDREVLHRPLGLRSP